MEDLITLRKIDSYLQGHPDMNKIPGIDMSAGSLGLGISAACGMALAGKIDNKDYRVYTIIGDGERKRVVRHQLDMHQSIRGSNTTAATTKILRVSPLGLKVYPLPID